VDRRGRLSRPLTAGFVPANAGLRTFADRPTTPPPLQAKPPAAARNPRRRHPLLIATRVGALAVLSLTAALWLEASAGAPRAPLRLAEEADRLLATAGLGIEQISISGHRFTPDGDVFAALDLARTASLLGFDAGAAEARLRQLPWVEQARVARSFPNAVEVSIRERAPFALWRRGERIELIDRTGRVLAPSRREAFPELPVVAGEGAGAAAAPLLALLRSHPGLASRLEQAVRHGGRRWTLRMAGAPEVHLPESGEAAALQRLLALDSRLAVLGGGYAAIDLRLDRTVLTPAAAPLAEAKAGRNEME
jgi:cell division protein FtsQ